MILLRHHPHCVNLHKANGEILPTLYAVLDYEMRSFGPA
jgi:hypothetical protein